MEHEIVSFDLVKINRGKQKICQCEKPHDEVDTVNRLVMCIDCGAIVDPFEAIQSLAERMEAIEELQKRMLEKAKGYEDLANNEIKRMIRNKTFRVMDSNYKNGLYPICPKCGQLFDPAAITVWSRKEE